MSYDENLLAFVEAAYGDELAKIAFAKGSVSGSVSRLVRPLVESFAGKPAPPVKIPKSLDELTRMERFKLGRKGRKKYVEDRQALLDQEAANKQRLQDIQNVADTAGKAITYGGAGLLGVGALNALSS
jgi:hypothetical protein